MWSARPGIPFGSLRGVNRCEPLGDGRVRVSKVFQVRGPFAPVFRLIWEKGVQAQLQAVAAHRLAGLLPPTGRAASPPP